MNQIKPSHITIDQGKTERIRFRDHQRLALVVNEGTAWITSSGDPCDYLIEKGQVFEIDAYRGDLVIESLSAHLDVEVFCA